MYFKTSSCTLLRGKHNLRDFLYTNKTGIIKSCKTFYVMSSAHANEIRKPVTVTGWAVKALTQRWKPSFIITNTMKIMFAGCKEALLLQLGIITRPFENGLE